MNVDVSTLRKVIVSALVAGIVAGISVVIANLSKEANFTTIQGVIFSGIVAVVKAAQKWIDSTYSGSALLGTDQ